MKNFSQDSNELGLGIKKKKNLKIIPSNKIKINSNKNSN